MEQLLIQLVVGALGGNGAGALLKDKSLGLIGNTIAGVVGGGAGGQILNSIVSGSGNGILGSVAGSLVGGGGLMVIIGFVKKLLAK